MHITLKDIAKKVGVSESTVSLALNDSPLVNINTKEKIVKAANDMGYSPNIIAKNLAKSKTNTIGLIIPDIESAFYSTLTKWIDQKARLAGYSVLNAISFDSRKIEKSIMKSFVAQRIEGVLVAPANKYNPGESHFATLDKYNVPYVYTSAYYEDTEDCMYVMGDLEQGAYKVASYLIGLGHKNIVFLCGKKDVTTTKLRLSGYMRAHREAGVPVIPEHIIESDTIDYEAACRETDNLIKSQTEFTAIMTLNDEMALGSVNTLQWAGYKVPDDISVAGYDDSVYSRVSNVPLTTVNQNLENVCMTAVNMLVSKIQGETINNSKVKVKQELIVRDSTRVNTK